MEIPKILIDNIGDGQVVLFLGAGASKGAVHPENKQPPDAKRLAEMICDRFLEKRYRDYPLSQIAELAISETDLFAVQQYIASIFREFKPAEFHKLVPRFVWTAISTTNYDLILERAYEEVKDKLQQPVPIKKNGERIEEKLRSPQNVLYFKLHGCITDINDPDVPLILTPDQYVTHRKGRSRLFERIQDLAYEFPFIFVGHSLMDIDLRTILLELTQLGEAKPRSYLVAPDMGSAEMRFWESRRMSCLQGTFEEFLHSINKEIPEHFRVLSIIREKQEHPIQSRFAVSESVKPSESLMTFLTRDVEYIYKGYKLGEIDPKAFYKGYFPDLAPIINELDVRRSISDDIMSEVILTTEEERIEKQQFFVIKGHAGSGKTVILRRLAWDAAIMFDKLCLLVKPFSNPGYEPLSELFTLCKERIFLFIDPASDFIDTIESFMLRARKDRIPLTIISAERHNEWNINCEDLEPFLAQSYEVKYLNEREIEELIRLLTKHKSLGYLEGLPLVEQRDAFTKRAGRQLLVALHEATLGKPFADIVFDEYKSIASRQAQSLYLTVCILHRLGVPTRAGLISRVHGISFTTFKEQLFEPLEFVVFAIMNDTIRDYVYQSRHPHIAEMVFERALVEQQDRYDEYLRIINELDVDYNSDRGAFRGLTSAKQMMSLFRNSELVRGIYKSAENRAPEDAKVLQQEAIFEMNAEGGSLERATDLLQRAYKKMSWSKSIAHSLSELALKKADKASNLLEKNKFRQESQAIAQKIVSDDAISPHPLHTLVKIGLDELSDIIKEGDQPTIERKINEVEKNLARALQLFPDSDYLLDAEAKFNELIDRNPQALEALKRAFGRNKRSPYIASRLAKMYEHIEKNEEAIAVLKECVEANPSDKDINFRLAMVLSNTAHANEAEIKHHLRRSFTKGDNRYHAQFWYARCLYLEGDFEGANEIFKNLSDANIDIRLKREPRGKLKKDRESVRYSGAVTRIEATYGFIQRDGYGDRIFIYRYHNHALEWEKLEFQTRVTFELAFNYRGPVALEVMLES
jgi:tetratricopeptide (TPR) repeat protein